MKPSAVIRSMAKNIKRLSLLNKCGLPETRGNCSLAGLLLEVYEAGGNKKITDCLYNGRNDSAKLMNLDWLIKRDTDDIAPNNKLYKELVLTKKGKQKAEYASQVLQNIINRIQTKTQIP